MSIPSPFSLLSTWLTEASADKRVGEPTAMTLATVSKEGKPSARVVLLKSADERGLTFYTNLNSRKSEELKQNQAAALCFFWIPLGRQIRIEGDVSPVSDAEADAYFASRPRESQIGSWASEQSRPLENRALLESRFSQFTEKYSGIAVPRPPHWSGWRLSPHYFEFWQAGEHRLHERKIYMFKNNSWETGLLFP